MPWFENRQGERLWFRDEGGGPVLLLVHGWCMSSDIWHYQFEGLRSRFRLVAPDLRGHGASRHVTGNCTITAAAEDLADLIRFLQLQQVVAAGWSLGAEVLMYSYPQLAQNLAGMILISGTPSFVSRIDYPWGLPATEVGGMRLKIRRSSERAREGFTGLMFSEVDRDQPEYDQLSRLISGQPLPEQSVMIDFLDVLEQTDLRHELAEIKHATLIICGDSDRICLPQASQFMAERIAGGVLAVFAGCGHVPFLTNRDDFNRRIIAFMESRSATQP